LVKLLLKKSSEIMRANQRKGILLAGGKGTRLHPLTIGVSKHLLPVYDKPMIYYSLSLLMLAGIREILVITCPKNQSNFKDLLGNGSQWGITLSYAIQDQPNGIAESLIIAEDFLNGAPCCLVLGDNLLFGHGLTDHLKKASNDLEKATILACHVTNPCAYGVVELDENNNPVSIVEKPTQPTSHHAVPGIYFYDASAPQKAASLTPSSRGELEITDLNRIYLEQNHLNVCLLNRGFAWFDTGTHASINEASDFIKAIETRMGLKIGCPEEIAYLKRWVSAEAILANTQANPNSDYNQYLRYMVTQNPDNHL
jgi:glucose-1-phosphate thymidylyltransferase